MGNQEIEKIKNELELYYGRTYNLETDMEILEDDYNFKHFADKLKPDERKTALITREYYKRYPNWTPDELLLQYKRDLQKDKHNELKQTLRSRYHRRK